MDEETVTLKRYTTDLGINYNSFAMRKHHYPDFPAEVGKINVPHVLRKIAVFNKRELDAFVAKHNIVAVAAVDDESDEVVPCPLESIKTPFNQMAFRFLSGRLQHAQ